MPVPFTDSWFTTCIRNYLNQWLRDTNNVNSFFWIEPRGCVRLKFSTCSSITELCRRKKNRGGEFPWGSQKPVARSMVSTNHWLGGIKTYTFLWWLTLACAHHASSHTSLAAVRSCKKRLCLNSHNLEAKKDEGHRFTAKPEVRY